MDEAKAHTQVSDSAYALPAAWALRVRGVVQGVGFRPFVYRLARRLGLTGWVRNDGRGVVIHVEGSPRRLERFRDWLARKAPPAADLVDVEGDPTLPLGHTDFRILPSAHAPGLGGGLRVPADRATCRACRREVFDATDRRFRYPFTNCTDCGPRYSIIHRLPYDRVATTMAGFVLCPDCRCEYESPDDRRFHAQPVACPACGPQVALWDTASRELTTGPDAIAVAAERLRAGAIVALKGLGGFQLLVRADDSTAVRRLRERKGRPTKPLAVMARDLKAAARLGRVGRLERQLLRSPENPIVLLERRRASGRWLAPEIAPHLRWVGVLLPTTPLHHLLLREVSFPVVATSGNISEEPIVTDECDALTLLAPIADVFLVHDRPVLRRVDDSVVRPVAARSVTIRSARGFTPLPLPALERWVARQHRPIPAGVLAVGGQQKSALALWTGTQAILGPHLGDLSGPDTRAAFERLTRELSELYGCPVAAVAHDLHPDYFSTRWATAQGHPAVGVQHHHAHAVAVMVEHDLLDEEVLAFTWDGTGYGPDGSVWGGEALRARIDGYGRVASLRPFPLPGGEKAIREPARVALVLLAEAVGAEVVLADGELLGRLGLSAATARALLHMAARGVNAPVTTSMGRLFDGVASLLLGANRVSYEGEAATWLESVATEAAVEGYPLPTGESADGLLRGDWRPLVRGVLADHRNGVDGAEIAARFHQAFADWATAVADRHPGRVVVLGGGCFQNGLLLERTRAALQAGGRRVYHASRVPPNDGGLAAGQLGSALAEFAIR